MEASACAGCGRSLGVAGASVYGRAGRRRSGSARGSNACDHGCGPGRAADAAACQSVGERIVDDTDHDYAGRNDDDDAHPAAGRIPDPATVNHTDHDHSNHPAGHYPAGHHDNYPAGNHHHQPTGRPVHDDDDLDADGQPVLRRFVGERVPRRVGVGGIDGSVVFGGIRCGVVGDRGQSVVWSVARKSSGIGIHCERWVIPNRRRVQC